MRAVFTFQQIRFPFKKIKLYRMVDIDLSTTLQPSVDVVIVYALQYQYYCGGCVKLQEKYRTIVTTILTLTITTRLYGSPNYSCSCTYREQNMKFTTWVGGTKSQPKRRTWVCFPGIGPNAYKGWVVRLGMEPASHILEAVQKLSVFKTT